MLEEANITSDLIERLGKGMSNLADSAQAMNGMASAAASTDKFVNTLDGAAEAVGSLKQATEAVNTLTTIYQETAQALTSGDASYADEMKKLASSLASVNAMYEMPLQTSTSQLEATKAVEERIQNMMANFADSAEGVLKYKDQVDALTRKVAELNNVYGNMLAAMQTRL
jgi:gliding motility-associated protein GldL